MHTSNARSRTWKAWTEQELIRLEQLRLEGKTLAAIAAELGRTVPSIRGCCVQEGITKGRALERWLTIFNAPHINAEVAARTGHTLGAVKQMKRRLHRAGFDTLMSQGPRRNGRSGKATAAASAAREVPA